MEDKYLERVRETWEELGHKIRPLRRIVLVRTDPLPDKTEGGIFVDPKLSENFYADLPHVSFHCATVLSAGRDSVLKPGDRIGFQRLFFARYAILKDRTLVGWIQDDRNILGKIEGESHYVEMAANLEPAPRAPGGLTHGRVLGGR